MTTPTPILGGCLCGAIRLSIAQPLGAAAYCHCTDCRKCTGSAFNVSVGVERRHLTLSGATPKGFTKAADSGTLLTRHFCPECGSPLFTASPLHPEVVYVKAGALDDPGQVRPAYQSWTRSRVAWATIPPELPGYTTSR